MLTFLTRDNPVRFPSGTEGVAIGRIESDNLRHVPIAHMRAVGHRVMQSGMRFHFPELWAPAPVGGQHTESG
jgi:hypothetical protein